MIQDARQVPQGSALDADIVIVGAGAAGITITRQLIGGGYSVALIESGGLEYDEDTQSLYQGASTGVPYPPLEASRLRFFGGSTNHWGGWCVPLDPIDFEKRDWAPLSGWPIDRDDLAAYYGRAQEICELGRPAYDAESWRPPGDRNALIGDAIVSSGVVQFSPPTRFGERYREEIRTADNVTALLYANAVELETEAEGAQIAAVRVRCIDGPEFRVTGRRFVLACGGIENARLLLLSRKTRPNGIGNEHDLVGRCFMDHPIVGRAATLLVSASSPLSSLYDDVRRVRGVAVRACLRPTAQFLRGHRRLNAMATLGPAAVYDADGTRRPAADDRVRRSGLAPLSLQQRLVARTKPVRPTGATEYGLGIAVETLPNPENRITLSHERDRLGLNRASLHWRPLSVERASLHANLMAVGQAVTLAGLGRFRLEIPADNAWPEDMFWGNHHMGTTRMAVSPRQGVVDEQCRVHGMGNLFIAGSSVFPTSGAANPTLTLLALALRLSDHLRSEVG